MCIRDRLKAYLEIMAKKKAEERNETFYVEMVERIKELLQTIDSEGKGELILNKLSDKLIIVANKIQSEYYEQVKHDKRFEKLVPIPLEAKESASTATDAKILESGILKMIYRASKCQQAC
eukprot:TRINITY_DN6913_c0_g1_i3.p1 TRINITY_DN6913_c0_g1~~TRINITY_DN6913_c0_g1_i3.p1  ORF type:complete len:121 (+),score=28.38 TRINITY_DN6913_c0_g1_i3:69-431(+)